MVYSMTGYGKGNLVLHGKDITVEVKSVNHRYFEYSSRMSRFFAFLDDKIKKEIQGMISRGKVEVSLMIRAVESSETKIEPDVLLAKSYYDALQTLSESLGLPNNADVLAISRMDGVLTQVKNEEDAETLWNDVKTVLHLAMEEFLTMRKAEGEKLCADVLARLETVEGIVAEIEKSAPARVDAYREKLYAKLQVILEDRQIDDARVLTEAAIFADKAAIDEETTRLHSHISQYRKILASNEPQGRKLDFLTQELNRETNTIGSKSTKLEVLNLVIEVKCELEKLREQSQNIE